MGFLEETTMRTSVEFLDAVKARHSLPSDYSLAPVLGITRAQVSRLRNRKDFLGNQTALKVAELLDLEPGIVLSAVHSERAKSESEKAAWNSIFEKMGGFAAGVFLVLTLGLSPTESRSDAGFQATGSALYIMSNQVRRMGNLLRLVLFPLFSISHSFR
jgi:plasmid maintenance system antidote protein VapI